MILFIKRKRDRLHLFDLYINGKFAESYITETEIYYVSSGNQQRFTLYFPSYAFPIISVVELEDATVFLPQKKLIDILFLGDSITHGAFAVNPSNSYVMRVKRNMDIGILNQGNSGFVYDAESIEKVCAPKIVVTAYGINDFHRKNIESIEIDTSEFLKKLKEVYKNSKLVSILPLWTIWNGSDENYKLCERNCIKSVYEKYSDYIIDGYNLVPDDAKYFADEVHPNDEGFAFYGDNLTKELEIVMTNASGDLHMGIFYFFEQTQFYSKEDSARYFLELIYWACAYKVKLFPEKCSKDIFNFNWFDRDKNKVELIREKRSTSVFVENLENHKRVEIDGWTTKH